MEGFSSDVFLFPLHPATLPVSFPATGLCSLLMGVGQREWSKKQRPVLPTLSPFRLLVAKCWCYSSELHLVLVFDLYSSSVDCLSWSLMDGFLSSYTAVSALILLETDCLKGSHYFQKNPVISVDHNSYQLLPPPPAVVITSVKTGCCCFFPPVCVIWIVCVPSRFWKENLIKEILM